VQFNRQRMGNMNNSLNFVNSKSAVLKELMQTVQDPYDQAEQNRVIAKLHSSNALMAQLILKLKVCAQII
jgi:hypothetical protein